MRPNSRAAVPEEITFFQAFLPFAYAVRRHLADIGVDVDAEMRAGRLRRARAVIDAFRTDLTDEDAQRIKTAERDLYDEHGLPA